jgi:hypothetical protein
VAGLLNDDLEIRFAYPSFLWSNLASNKAAVTVSIIGMGAKSNNVKRLYVGDQVQEAELIGPYLVPNQDTVISSERKPISRLPPMSNGSMPNDSGSLLLSSEEYRKLIANSPNAERYCRRFIGSSDGIQGEMRYCIWIKDSEAKAAQEMDEIARRIDAVKEHRIDSDRKETNALAAVPHAFGERRHRDGWALVVPRHSSENRLYLPSIIVNEKTIIGDSAIALYGFSLTDFAIYSSRMHLVWVATVCGKIKTDYRYSNTLGWNTFPVPKLTDKNKADLTHCAEDILLARETHFPATIADLYDPEIMPADVRAAHERNDETLERIYIGRRFRNDTERLEELFELYTKMVGSKDGQDKRLNRERSIVAGS